MSFAFKINIAFSLSDVEFEQMIIRSAHVSDALKIYIYSVERNVERLADLSLVKFIGGPYIDDGGPAAESFFDFIISNAEYG